MQVMELHKILAHSIGDAIEPYEDPDNAGTYIIPDGARYSKTLRDSYLYRAALSIIERSVKIVVQLPRQEAGAYLRKWFPNMFAETIIALSTFTEDNTKSRYSRYHKIEDIGMAYAATVLYQDATNSYPIVIQDSIRVGQLNNTKITHLPDPFTHVLGTPTGTMIEIFNTYDNFTVDGEIRFIYLPYPDDPADLDPDTDYVFEKMHIKQLLNIASVYARFDSQDGNDLNQFMQIEMGGA